MKKNITAALMMIALAVSLASLTGCAKLDKDGVYQGDKVLYDADRSIASAYDLLHSFVTWEKTNRATLSDHPEVKNFADHIRLNAERWIGSAIALRDAYATNPTNSNRAALQKSVAVLRATLDGVAEYMTK